MVSGLINVWLKFVGAFFLANGSFYKLKCGATACCVCGPTGCSLGAVGEFFFGGSNIPVFLAQSLANDLLFWWRQLLKREDLTVKHTNVDVRAGDALLTNSRCEVNPRWPVVHLVGCWEAFCRPVKETVEKDAGGEASPRPHDHLEGHACVVDELGRAGGSNVPYYSGHVLQPSSWLFGYAELCNTGVHFNKLFRACRASELVII